jgi:type I restriction enzyme, S subunit
MTTNGNGKRPLPDGWIDVSLKEVAHIERGITFPASAKQNLPFEGGIACLRTANVQFEVDWDDLIYVSRKYVKKEEKLLRESDILISMANSYELVGKVSFVPRVKENSSFGGFIAAIRTNTAILPKFLFYQLRTTAVQSEMRKSSSQTVNIANLSLSRLYPISIRLAPLPVQERIVAEIEKQFTRLDTAVSTLNRLQSNLDRYQASLLKAACTGQLLPQDPNDEPAERLLQRILAERRQRWLETEWQNQVERAQKKAAQAQRQAAGRPHHIRDLDPADWQSIPEAQYAPYLPQNDKWQKKYKEPAAVETAVLPDLPPGWVWATVEQIAAHESNSITDGPFGSKLKTAHYTDSGPRVIRLQNIGDGEFVDEKAHISNEHYEFLKKHRVFVGDLVIAGLGVSLPRACIIPDYVGPAIVKADCIRFKPHPKIATAKYLNAALNSDLLKKFAANIVHGIGRPRLNQQEIKSLVIPLPPLAEQHRIVAELERCLSVVTATRQAISANQTRSGRLRQSILQQAFNGRLV